MKTRGWAAAAGIGLTAVLAACNPADKTGDPAGGKAADAAPAPVASAGSAAPGTPQAAAPTASASAAPASDSSGACFNMALRTHAGSVVEYDERKQGGGASKVQRTRKEVIGPTTYKGRPAIESRVNVTGPGEDRYEAREYLMLEDGSSEMRAEHKGSSSGWVLDPPERFKIDMQPGETFKTEHVVRTQEGGAGAPVGKATITVTYMGRKPIETAWGPVQACYFEVVHESRTTVVNQHLKIAHWVTASGPYPGLLVRNTIEARHTPPGSLITTVDEILKVHTFTMR